MTQKTRKASTHAHVAAGTKRRGPQRANDGDQAARRKPASVTRRTFVKGLGAGGALLGLPHLPVDDAKAQSASTRAPRRRETRTLIFNLSHLGPAAVGTTHYAYIGGRKFRLAHVSEAPQVLARERRRNEFLQSLPDHQLTHVAVAEVPSDSVGLAYVTCNENTTTGMWEMTGTFFHPPLTALAHAYRLARVRTPQGPLPLSGKRKRYGVRPATTLKDLRDEAVLVDPASFAEALVGAHPDILSLDPDSHSHIHTNYIGTDGTTQFLAVQLSSTYGPATVGGTTSVSGKPPWGTLQPLVNPATNQPFKKSDGQLNQYYPDWNPTVSQLAPSAVNNVHPLVKDDTTLGIDVTPYNLNDPNDQPTPQQLGGTLWARHDGNPSVIRQPALAGASAPTVTFTNQNVETGLYVTPPDVSQTSDGRTQIVLDDVSNWFLRYLGLWVQFLDPNGNVLPLSGLPNDTFPAEPGPYPRTQDKADAMFLGVVASAVAVCAIPVYPGSFSPTLNIPTSASSVRIFYTGLGLSGSIPQEPQNIYDHGALMTMAFNYGVVGLFMAAGSSTYGPTFKLAVGLAGGAIATAIQAIVGGVTNQANFARGLLAFAMGFLKTLFGVGISKALVPIIEAIAEELVEAEIIDSIPIAGQIARAVAAVTGALTLAETTIEIALSPAAYIFDVVQTHSLSVTFLPDQNHTQFPQPPAGYTLYYKTTYMFDNGTAHTQDAVTVPDPTVKSISVQFPGVPFGGNVNVSIGFYMRRNSTPAGQNDWCAGYATTGLVPNNVDTIPPPTGLTGFQIIETKVPIQSTTQYIHTRKTALDANGNHLWQTDPTGTNAPPYLPPAGGQTPSLGGFGSITVRQGTSGLQPQQGYVGYAWTAFSSGVSGCGTPGAPGQFDQMANLNTDAGNNGANAQNGYINSLSLCGYQQGVRVGYNLLTHKSLNMYVDTTALMIRQVNLDPPGYAGPSSNQSFAMLNFDSTRCLLHPAGHIVSISNDNHKLEIQKLPAAAQADNVTAQYFLARTCSGQGSRPGLMNSPIAAVISPEGAIIVLEAGNNNRLQAFDLGGNPVPYFTGQSTPYFLQLDPTAQYLDVAVEFSGYLYLLAQDANGNHRLDIYHPTQRGNAPICTTTGVNAAALAVDFWRSVYSLNYTILQLPNGQIPSFTEPTVSLWVPTPPSV